MRPQLGRGWGHSDDPDCSGTAVEDFERVDWERVSLDEWLAILAETGNYPTLEDLDLEDLTSTGSEHDLSDERKDAAERSDTPSDGLDSDEARRGRRPSCGSPRCRLCPKGVT
jgi:conjugal transfer mating pair stabilization protein TraN